MKNSYIKIIASLLITIILMLNINSIVSASTAFFLQVRVVDEDNNPIGNVSVHADCDTDYMGYSDTFEWDEQTNSNGIASMTAVKLSVGRYNGHVSITGVPQEYNLPETAVAYLVSTNTQLEFTYFGITSGNSIVKSSNLNGSTGEITITLTRKQQTEPQVNENDVNFNLKITDQNGDGVENVQISVMDQNGLFESVNKLTNENGMTLVGTFEMDATKFQCTPKIEITNIPSGYTLNGTNIAWPGWRINTSSSGGMETWSQGGVNQEDVVWDSTSRTIDVTWKALEKNTEEIPPEEPTQPEEQETPVEQSITQINFKTKIVDSKGIEVPGVKISIRDQKGLFTTEEKTTNENGEAIIVVNMNSEDRNRCEPEITLTKIPEGYEALYNGSFFPGWMIESDGTVIPWSQSQGTTVTYDKDTKTVTAVCKVLKNNKKADIILTNVEGIGNIFNVVSSKASEDRTVSVADAVSKINKQEINVIEIKDNEEKSVDLSSNSPIGTGYKIITSVGEYTVIVYGDATGDGLINAADISFVINSFLGISTNASNESKIAADLHQDNNLDAADIALMINSFLGNLKGNVLDGEIKGEPIEESEPEPELESDSDILSSVVSVGDTVDYPITVNSTYMKETSDSNWKVLKVENGKVYLTTDKMITGDLALIEWVNNQHIWNSNEILENMIDSITNHFYDVCDQINITNRFINDEYAESSRAFNYQDAQAVIGTTGEIVSATNYGQISDYELLKTDYSYSLWNIEYNLGGENYMYRITGAEEFNKYFIWPSKEEGYSAIRPVVVLKADVRTNGQDSNGVWQLKSNSQPEDDDTRTPCTNVNLVLSMFQLNDSDGAFWAETDTARDATGTDFSMYFKYSKPDSEGKFDDYFRDSVPNSTVDYYINVYRSNSSGEKDISTKGTFKISVTYDNKGYISNATISKVSGDYTINSQSYRDDAVMLTLTF